MIHHARARLRPRHYQEEARPPTKNVAPVNARGIDLTPAVVERPPIEAKTLNLGLLKGLKERIYVR